MKKYILIILTILTMACLLTGCTLKERQLDELTTELNKAVNSDILSFSHVSEKGNEYYYIIKSPNTAGADEEIKKLYNAANEYFASHKDSREVIIYVEVNHYDRGVKMNVTNFTKEADSDHINKNLVWGISDMYKQYDPAYQYELNNKEYWESFGGDVEIEYGNTFYENLVEEELDDNLSFDDVVGTYLYKSGDEEEERVFEIGKIADKFYIEYMGLYEYAAGEVEIIESKATEQEEKEFEVIIYPFSGFSFMGDYWGAGNKCSIIQHKNGDIVLSKEQPYITEGELELIRKDGISPHEITLDTKKAECKELVGEWGYTTQREGETVEVTLSFDENGVFKASHKIQDYVPLIYVGKYTIEETKDGISGDILCEAVGYGDMPYEWKVYYDEMLKCPVIDSVDLYAQPFTVDEDKNFPFEKISENDKGMTPGPGKRAFEVQTLYEEYISVEDVEE